MNDFGTAYVPDHPGFVEILMTNPIAFWACFVVVVWMLGLAVALFAGHRAAKNKFFTAEAPPVPDRKGRRLRSVK